MIHYKNSNRYEEWREYDENDNLIHIKNSNGYEEWYDENGNEIENPNKPKDNKINYNEVVRREEYEDGSITEYNINDNIIYSKNSNNIEHWREYNEIGKCIYFKSSNGYESWKEYDENGNIIYFKNSCGSEVWREYDENIPIKSIHKERYKDLLIKKTRIHGEIKNKFFIKNKKDPSICVLESITYERIPAIFNSKDDILLYLNMQEVDEEEMKDIIIEPTNISFFDNDALLIEFEKNQ